MKDRQISHQNYYILPNGIECFDVIRYFPCDIGMAIKYLWRHGKKNEDGIDSAKKAIEDLKKAKYCIDDHLKMLEDAYNKSS